LLLLVIYEGTDVYHTVFHNHGFRTMDFTTKNLRNKFADKKSSYVSVKSKTIITNDCVPWAPEDLKNDLKCANSVTVSCNASNHKYEKQLQNLVVIIRCMIWKTQ
jgi:hypothetical protein